MFIKFGDKTKAKEVSDEELENQDVEAEEKKDNRRIPILKSYKKVTQKNILYNKKLK